MANYGEFNLAADRNYKVGDVVTSRNRTYTCIKFLHRSLRRFPQDDALHWEESADASPASVAAVATNLTALKAATVGVVTHGAVAGTARPTGFAKVQWQGTVEPTNAIDGDEWIDTTP